jgi:hypothetical protein
VETPTQELKAVLQVHLTLKSCQFSIHAMRMRQISLACHCIQTVKLKLLSVEESVVQRTAHSKEPASLCGLATTPYAYSRQHQVIKTPENLHATTCTDINAVQSSPSSTSRTIQSGRTDKKQRSVKKQE